MELLTSLIRLRILEVEQRAETVLSRGSLIGKVGYDGDTYNSLSQLKHLNAPFFTALSLL